MYLPVPCALAQQAFCSHARPAAPSHAFPCCWMQQHCHAATVHVRPRCDPLNPHAHRECRNECAQLHPPSCHHLPPLTMQPQTHSWQVSVPPVLLDKGTAGWECRQCPKQICCLQRPCKQFTLLGRNHAGTAAGACSSQCSCGSGADACPQRVQTQERKEEAAKPQHQGLRQPARTSGHLTLPP